MSYSNFDANALGTAAGGINAEGYGNTVLPVEFAGRAAFDYREAGGSAAVDSGDPADAFDREPVARALRPPRPGDSPPPRGNSEGAAAVSPWMRGAILAACLLSGCASVPVAPARPNVIVVLSDDQGYGDFSCHGNPVLRTPNLDRLGDESIRLTDFHVAPMCTPTRGQLLTGMDALRNGASSVCAGRSYLRPAVPTMAEVFRAAGYRTALFG